MAKVKAKIETDYLKTPEHKKFLKGFDVRGVFTSKTRDGRKFLEFMVKDENELMSLAAACHKNKYTFTHE